MLMMILMMIRKLRKRDEKELMVMTLKASQIVEVHTRAANFPTSRGSTPEL